MSTRSDIIVERADGKFARIYCHWDGYLDHNGKLLAEHYVTQQKCEALVANGDLSSLAPECENPPEGHTFDNRADGHSVYYGRDRGETDVDAKVFDSLFGAWPPEDSWTEFTYVWLRGEGDPDLAGWWVADLEKPQSLIRLSHALNGKARAEGRMIHPKVKMFGGFELGVWQ